MEYLSILFMTQVKSRNFDKQQDLVQFAKKLLSYFSKNNNITPVLQKKKQHEFTTN